MYNIGPGQFVSEIPKSDFEKSLKTEGIGKGEEVNWKPPKEIDDLCENNLRQKMTQRPKVFLEFTVANKKVGRVEIELYSDIVPVTAENFRALCTGWFHCF